MTFKISWAIAMALFTIINLTALAANWSITARAEVAGKDYRDLEKDPDFKRAVEYIAEDVATHTIERCWVGGRNIFC